jgi:hypothetical protein
MFFEPSAYYGKERGKNEREGGRSNLNESDVASVMLHLQCRDAPLELTWNLEHCLQIPRERQQDFQ